MKALYFSSQRAALPGGEEGLFIGGVKICPLGLSCSRPDMSGGGADLSGGCVLEGHNYLSGGVRTCPVVSGHVRWGPDLSGGSVLEGHIYLSGEVRTCPVGCGHVRWDPDLSGGSVLEGHICFGIST